MSTSIVMPQLGLTMTEGTVSGWLKKTGDVVRKNEPVLTVATDKVEMEVESLVEGTLGEIVVQVGTTVPVGTTLAYVVGGKKDSGKVGAEPPGPAISPAAETEKGKSVSRSSTSSATPIAEDRAKLAKTDRRHSVSPRAKRLAGELGLDITKIRGSGSAGEIVEDDIRRAASEDQSAVPGLRRRQLIAERLTRSIQSIPTFSVSAEANAEKLLALYESLRRPPSPDGIKVTITDLLLAIFSAVLAASPEMCATWEKDAPRQNSSIDIGLAVATPEGVMAPVLREVDKLDLPHLVARRHELADKARRGKLSLAELEGGVSTLSNLGMYRVDKFEALISPGQSSILAVGSIRKRPWVAETLGIKPTVIFNLIVDHRIADGAAAATFLGKLIEQVEEPALRRGQPVGPHGDGANRGLHG
jgi:pyruvate dehydrogenase E2 component (dihydrolipoamide acetyltransferase)